MNNETVIKMEKQIFFLISNLFLFFSSALPFYRRKPIIYYKMGSFRIRHVN